MSNSPVRVLVSIIFEDGAELPYRVAFPGEIELDVRLQELMTRHGRPVTIRLEFWHEAEASV